MTDIDKIGQLLSEYPDGQTPDIIRIQYAIDHSDKRKAAGPRLHGSKILSDEESVGLINAIKGDKAIEIHQTGEFVYFVFPIKSELNIVINTVPSYLLSPSTKVEVGISPKGTPQIVANDKIMGLMDPAGELVVILRGKEFITWFPMSDGEEPWNMTALKITPEHMGMAKAKKIYRISNLESYLGGSFDVMRKSKEFHQIK